MPNRHLAVLFSDISQFTTISESLSPDDIVESLNRSFTMMVEIIMDHDGIVDKYIGDAIMAFFGAPVKHDNDPEQATIVAIKMLEVLEKFNQQQTERGKPHFSIGIGINYGEVTVGNIGSERKVDYTVVGDMVNLSSRLESLTKEYKQPILISKSVAKAIHKTIPCRWVDKVRVKGKQQETKIYAPKRELTQQERNGWKLYNEALRHYYRRNSSNSLTYLQKAQNYLPEDYLVKLYIERANTFLREAPPEDWDGVESLSEK